MRTVMAVAFVGLCALGTVVVSAEPPAKDLLAEMKQCDVCKAMADKPELLSHLTWETHKIDNGMLSVITVPKEMKNDLAAMHEKMMANVAKVKSQVKAGHDPKLCSHCAGMGELEKAGAKQQVIETPTGAVTLLTSENPEVVKKIHTQADAAIAMQKKIGEQSN